MSELIQYVIYDSPKDYPGKWVVRKWLITPGQITPGPAYICDSLEAAREHVPEGMYNLGRQPNDERPIQEVWA
jgi:hypothetical protein